MNIQNPEIESLVTRIEGGANLIGNETVRRKLEYFRERLDRTILRMKKTNTVKSRIISLLERVKSILPPTAHYEYEAYSKAHLSYKDQEGWYEFDDIDPGSLPAGLQTGDEIDIIPIIDDAGIVIGLEIKSGARVKKISPKKKKKQNPELPKLPKDWSNKEQVERHFEESEALEKKFHPFLTRPSGDE